MLRTRGYAGRDQSQHHKLRWLLGIIVVKGGTE
jgi:hypothetical protein